MSTEKSDAVYSTADFRKNIGMAFGRAYHRGEVVRVQNHNRPYVAVVSDEAANVVEAMQKPEPTYEEMLELVRFMSWEPKRLETLSEMIRQKFTIEAEPSEPHGRTVSKRLGEPLGSVAGGRTRQQA